MEAEVGGSGSSGRVRLRELTEAGVGSSMRGEEDAG